MRDWSRAPDSRSLLELAASAAGRGWFVFPLCPGSKRPRAELAEWEPRATVDVDVIARWWTTHPRDNIGLACGPSGLLVVDLDTPKPGETPPAEWADARHGADVFDHLARRHGAPVACTWTVATPGGGRHLYYRQPAGAALRSTQGRLGWRIDTRAHGGYVVAAGSIVDGRRYELADPTAPAELPDWIARLLEPPPPPRRRPSPGVVARPGSYADAALAGEVARVLDAPPGGRNHALNKAAWNLGRLVTAGRLDRADVEDALQRAAEAAGYRDGPRAAAAVIQAALDARCRPRPAAVAPVERHPRQARTRGADHRPGHVPD